MHSRPSIPQHPGPGVTSRMQTCVMPFPSHRCLRALPSAPLTPLTGGHVSHEWPSRSKGSPSASRLQRMINAWVSLHCVEHSSCEPSPHLQPQILLPCIFSANSLLTHANCYASLGHPPHAIHQTVTLALSSECSLGGNLKPAMMYEGLLRGIMEDE